MQDDAGAARSVRGFDGTTIKVAGIGIQSQFGQEPIGARARIKRFNDDNEIKGVKIDHTEFVDDKQDPATSLSETRRLVTQTGVFAIVGDVSQNNNSDYLKQQHVSTSGSRSTTPTAARSLTRRSTGSATTAASSRANRP